MAMPPSGTFHYQGFVPVEWAGGEATFEMHDPTGAEQGSSSDPLYSNRLVGFRPQIAFVGEELVLTASSRYRASCMTVSIPFHPKLVAEIRPKDCITIDRSATADIGLSLVREERLIYALGAVTRVWVGRGISFRHADAEGLAIKPRSLKFESAYTLRVTINGADAIFRKGDDRVLGEYRVTALSCFRPGIPGDFECLAMTRASMDLQLAAVSTAPAQISMKEFP